MTPENNYFKFKLNKSMEEAFKQFEGEISASEFEQDPKLKNLYSIFNKDKKSGLNKKEIETVFKELQKYSAKNNFDKNQDSSLMLDEYEAAQFANSKYDSKDVNTKGITPDDVYRFFNLILEKVAPDKTKLDKTYISLEDYTVETDDGEKKLSDLSSDISKKNIHNKKMFEAFDINQNDVLNNDEVLQLMQFLIYQADIDGDLKISKEEQDILSNFYKNVFGINDVNLGGFLTEIFRVSKLPPIETVQLSNGDTIYSMVLHDDDTQTTDVGLPSGEIKKRYIVTDQDESNYSLPDSLSIPLGLSISNIPEIVVTNNYAQAIETKRPNVYVEYTKTGQQQVRDFILNHMRETNEAFQNSMERYYMQRGDLDWTGVVTSNALRTIGNEFHKGTSLNPEDDEKFPTIKMLSGDNYRKVKIADKLSEVEPDNFVEVFERLTGRKFNYEKADNFSKTAYKYTKVKSLEAVSTSLKQAVDELDEMSIYHSKTYSAKEVKLYADKGITIREGEHKFEYKTALYHLSNYFGSKDEAEIFLKSLGITEESREKNKLLKDAFQNLRDSNNKILEDTLQDETVEELKNRYKQEYKDIYGIRNTNEDIDELIGEAQGYTSIYKIGLVIATGMATASFMEALTGALTSAEGAGIASNITRSIQNTLQLAERLKAQGQIAQAEALIADAKAASDFMRTTIGVLSPTTTVATDVLISALNKSTSKMGIAGQYEELVEGAKSSAKYIYFGHFISGPLGQQVSKWIQSSKPVSKAFEGVKASGGIKAVSGDYFMDSMSASLAPGAGKLLTEIAAYAGLDLATEDIGLKDALKGSTTMQVQLGILSRFLQTIMGSKLHSGYYKKMQKEFLKNIVINETVSQEGKKNYSVKFNGATQFATDNPNELTAYIITTSSYYASAMDKNSKKVGVNGVNEGVNGVNEGINEGKEPYRSAVPKDNEATREPSEKVIPQDTNDNVKNGRTLEGGVKDSELTEVAPFAQRLNNPITFEDLIYSGRDKIIPFAKGSRVKELSDSEFETLKTKVEEKINKLPKGSKDHLLNLIKTLTKENIQIVDRLVSTKDAFDKINIFANALYSLKNINQAKMFEFVMDNYSELWNIRTTDIIEKTQAPEQLQLRIELMKLALTNQQYRNSSHIENIVLNSKSIEEAAHTFEYTEKYGITEQKRAELAKQFGQQKVDKMIEDFAKAKEELGLNVDKLICFGESHTNTGDLSNEKAEKINYEGDYITAESKFPKDNLTFYFDKESGELLSIKDDENNIVYNLKDKKIIKTIPTAIWHDKESLGNNNKLLGAVTETTDLNGNWLGSVEFVKSKVPGEFEIYEYDINGKRYKSGLVEFDKQGGKHIEKRMTSLDGTVTEQVYADDKIGNRYMYYKTTDSSGNVLYESTKIFKIIDKNHFVSTDDGISYDIQYTNDNVTVVRLDEKGNKTNEKVVYKIKDYTQSDYAAMEKFEAEIRKDEKKWEQIQNREKTLAQAMVEAGIYEPHTVDKKLLPALKQLSGEEWFQYEISGTEAITLANIKDNGHSSHGAIGISKDRRNDASLLEHESGHEKDNLSKWSEDEEFVRIYNEEKSLCKKYMPEIELDQLDYFMETHLSNPMGETGAEANQITNVPNKRKTIGSRSMFLQRFLARTIAYVANKNRARVNPKFAEDFEAYKQKLKSSTDNQIVQDNNTASSPVIKNANAGKLSQENDRATEPETRQNGFGQTIKTQASKVSALIKDQIKSLRESHSDYTLDENGQYVIENGEFNENGEFVSDGTYSVGTSAKNLRTYKRMPSGYNEEVATNRKALDKQILYLVGGRELPANVKFLLDKMLENPNVKPADISEAILNMRNLSNPLHYDVNFIKQLSEINDFRQFKTNLEQFVQFNAKLEELNNSRGTRTYQNNFRNYLLHSLKDIHGSKLISLLSDVKPEVLSKNMQTFIEMGADLKDACYDNRIVEFLFKEHSEKFFERLNFIDEFNKNQYEKNSSSRCKMIFENGGLENDNAFETIKKHIETYPRAKNFERSGYSASYMLNEESTRIDDAYLEFEQKIPEEKRNYASYLFSTLQRECPQNVDKYAEFVNALPLEMLKLLSGTTHENINNIQDSFHNGSYGRAYKQKILSPDELIIRAKILAKVPNLGCSNGYGLSGYNIANFLINAKIPDSAKVLEFVENAEPSYLAQVRMPGDYRDIKFSSITDAANLDSMIENAKLHHELPESYREYLNSRDSSANSRNYPKEGKYAYELPPEEFRARVDIIKQYGDEVPPRILDDIYCGKIHVSDYNDKQSGNDKPLDGADKQPYIGMREMDALAKIPTALQEKLWFRTINKLVEYTDNGLDTLVKIANDYASRNDNANYDKMGDFAYAVERDGFITMMNLMNSEEILLLDDNVIVSEGLHMTEEKAKIIKERIASIPKNVRPYFRDNGSGILYNVYYHNVFTKENKLPEDSPFNYLATLSQTELEALGPNTINSYIDNYKNIKSFEPQKLTKLTQLPKQILDLLDKYKYKMLINNKNQSIDVDKIIQRYNDLAQFKKTEKLDPVTFKYIVDMSEAEYSVITECLNRYGDKLDNKKFHGICNQMHEFAKREGLNVPEEIEYIKGLINNPQSSPSHLDDEIRFLYNSKFAEGNPDKLNYRKSLVEALFKKAAQKGTEAPLVILSNAGWNKDIETVKAIWECGNIAWDNPGVDITEIGTLINQIDTGCYKFALKMFHSPDFNEKMKFIPNFLRNITEDNQKVADYIAFEKPDRFSKLELNTEIIMNVSEINRAFIENICKEENFTYKSLIELAKYTKRDKNHLQTAERLVGNPDIAKWANKNIDNGLTVEEVALLSNTQKNIYRDIASKKQVKQQVHTETPAEVESEAINTITKALSDLGLDPVMAKRAYANLCVDKYGNVDEVKLDAACSLIKVFGFTTTVKKKTGKPVTNPNLSPKDLSDIFALSIGDKLSSQNGQFRPQVIYDIIALKECGINDVRLAINIAAVKNMDLIEMKAKMSGKTRQDLANRLSKLYETNLEISESLKSRGIDLEKIKEKALTSDKKIPDAKIKEGQAETIHIRTSIESLIGTEKIAAKKFKHLMKNNEWAKEEEFKRWAIKKLKSIYNPDASNGEGEIGSEFMAQGQYEPINKDRLRSIKAWYEYLTKESNIKNDVFAQLLFMDGITKELKPDNALPPPEFIEENYEELYNSFIADDNNSSLISINTAINRRKAIAKYSHGIKTSSDGVVGQWVSIPQTYPKSPDFRTHVAMVQSLSEGSSWCLRGSNAEGYLKGGNLHFFVDKDGKSQVAVNETDGKITQLQKRYNQNSTVPVPYAVVISEWIKSYNPPLTGIENEINTALSKKPEFDKQKVRFTQLLAEGNAETILKEAGMEVTTLEDGTYSLDNYTPFVNRQPYTFQDMGIKEDALLANVSEIRGSMNLNGSNASTLPKLKRVSATINLGDSSINDVRNLEELNGKKIYWDKSGVPSEPAKNEKQPVINDAVLNGEAAAENSILQAAVKENPADFAEKKVQSQWTQSDLRTPETKAKVDLFNLDTNAGLKEKPVEVMNEVTELIFKGKLKETLESRYNNAKEILKNVLDKNKDRIQQLAETHSSDKQAFAQEIVNLLCEEFNMGDVGIPVVVVPKDSMQTLAAFNSSSGEIYIREDIQDSSSIAELILHEFNHFIQFADVVSQYGSNGIKEILLSGRNQGILSKFNDEEINLLFEELISSDYMQKLIEFGKENKAKDGSINNYIRRIYKDEMSNYSSADTKEKQKSDYADQLLEREAYFIGSGNSENLHLIKLLSDEEIKSLKMNEIDLQETSDGYIYKINKDGTVHTFGRRASGELLNFDTNTDSGSILVLEQRVQNLMSKLPKGSRIVKPFIVEINGEKFSIEIDKSKQGKTIVTVKDSIYTDKNGIKKPAKDHRALEYIIDDADQVTEAHFYKGNYIASESYNYKLDESGERTITARTSEYYQDSYNYIYRIDSDGDWIATETKEPGGVVYRRELIPEEYKHDGLLSMFFNAIDKYKIKTKNVEVKIETEQTSSVEQNSPQQSTAYQSTAPQFKIEGERAFGALELVRDSVKEAVREFIGYEIFLNSVVMFNKMPDDGYFMHQVERLVKNSKNLNPDTKIFLKNIIKEIVLEKIQGINVSSTSDIESAMAEAKSQLDIKTPSKSFFAKNLFLTKDVLQAFKDYGLNVGEIASLINTDMGTTGKALKSFDIKIDGRTKEGTAKTEESKNDSDTSTDDKNTESDVANGTEDTDVEEGSSSRGKNPIISESDKIEIMQCRKDGLTIADLFEMFPNIPQKSILRFLKSKGMFKTIVSTNKIIISYKNIVQTPSRAGKLILDSRADVRQIAKALGCNELAVELVLRTRGLYREEKIYNRAESDKIKELYDKTKSVTEVVKALAEEPGFQARSTLYVIKRLADKGVNEILDKYVNNYNVVIDEEKDILSLFDSGMKLPEIQKLYGDDIDVEKILTKNKRIEIPSLLKIDFPNIEELSQNIDMVRDLASDFYFSKELQSNKFFCNLCEFINERESMTDKNLKDSALCLKAIYDFVKGKITKEELENNEAVNNIIAWQKILLEMRTSPQGKAIETRLSESNISDNFKQVIQKCLNDKSLQNDENAILYIRKLEEIINNYDLDKITLTDFVKHFDTKKIVDRNIIDSFYRSFYMLSDTKCIATGDNGWRAEAILTAKAKNEIYKVYGIRCLDDMILFERALQTYTSDKGAGIKKVKWRDGSHVIEIYELKIVGPSKTDRFVASNGDCIFDSFLKDGIHAKKNRDRMVKIAKRIYHMKEEEKQQVRTKK